LAPAASPDRIPLLQRLRRLHPPVVVAVRATPEACLQALEAASRPRLERLHLRDLYAGGRRYYLEPRPNGFRLRSNTKLLWGPSRARTPFAATLTGAFAPLAADAVSLRLEARSGWLPGARGLLFPVWTSAIALAMPWPPGLRLAAVALLLALAWTGNRLHAALEAAEMVFFVQKTLADLPPADLPELRAAAPDVVADGTRRDFDDQWRKFHGPRQP
jgi:hypothetical protein